MIKVDVDFKNDFNKDATIKVLVTFNKEGKIQVDFRNLIYMTDEGEIQLFELMENSQVNKNLLFSLWFDKNIFISVLTETHCSYQMELLPRRIITSGSEFTKCYTWIQKNIGDYDLAAVWILKPMSIVETSVLKQIENEKNKYPMINHLDRLLRE